MAVEARETLVGDGAGAAHQRDADARTPPLTAREAAAAGEAAANPRVGDGSEESWARRSSTRVARSASATRRRRRAAAKRIASRGVSSSGSTLSCGTTATEPRGSAHRHAVHGHLT